MKYSLITKKDYKETDNSIIFLLIIIVLYQLKGVLYTEGIISMGLALIELSFCAYFMLKTILKKNISNIAFSLSILLLILSLSFMFSPKHLTGEFNTFVMYRHIVGAILPFFPFYDCSRQGKINEKTLRVFFYVIFLVYILVFSKATFIAAEKYTSSITINEAYRFVTLLPLLAFIKTKWIPLFIIISIICLLIGVKRGAILAYSIGVLIYAYFYFRFSQNYVKNFFILLILLIIVGLICIEMYQNNPYLQLRLENTLEGNSSSRDYIYEKIFKYWFNNDNLLNLIFGIGFCQTVSIAGNLAHNDWLEFLIGMGLIGFFTYALTFYFLFRFLSLNRYVPQLPLVLCVILLFFTSFYSMAFWSEPSYTYFISIGYLLGRSEFLRKI